MRFFGFFIKTSGLGAELDFIDVGYSCDVLDILLQVLNQLVLSRKIVWVHSLSFGHVAQMGMLPLSTAFCIHRIVLHIHATLLPAHVHLVEEFIIIKFSANRRLILRRDTMDLVTHEGVVVIFFDFLRLKFVGLVSSLIFDHYLKVQNK